jgi:hypothetical protein
VQWISENREWSLESVQEASMVFDLTPLEEEFLVDQFVRHQGIGQEGGE